MNINEHYKFCKQCTHRQLDLKTGLQCDLTNKKPDFNNTCPTFQLDPAVSVFTDSGGNLSHDEIVDRIVNEKYYNSYDRILKNENFPRAVITGVIAAIFCAALWALVTIATQVFIGLLAIVIGAVIGGAMNIAGKGISSRFAVAAAIITTISCIVGHFFSFIGITAKTEGISMMQLLVYIDYTKLPMVFAKSFTPITIFIYLLAILEASKFAVIRKKSSTKKFGIRDSKENRGFLNSK